MKNDMAPSRPKEAVQCHRDESEVGDIHDGLLTDRVQGTVDRELFVVDTNAGTGSIYQVAGKEKNIAGKNEDLPA